MAEQPEREGWFMSLKRAVSRVLVGRKNVEAKERDDAALEEQRHRIEARIAKSEKNSLDVTQEIELLVAAHGPLGKDEA